MAAVRLDGDRRLVAVSAVLRAVDRPVQPVDPRQSRLVAGTEPDHHRLARPRLSRRARRKPSRPARSGPAASSVRTAVDSTPAPETERTSTGVPPSGRSPKRDRRGHDRVTAADPHAIAAHARHRRRALGRQRQLGAALPAVGRARTSGAPGGVSSKRSVTGGANGPTLPAASSSATRSPYSPGPSDAATEASHSAPADELRRDIHAARHRPDTPSRARARAAPPARPAAARTSVRDRDGLQPAPPSSTGAGSAGAVLSTRTTRETDAQFPAASCADSASVCSPSPQPCVSKTRARRPVRARHRPGEVARRARRRGSTRPSSAIRPSRIPLLSAASKATSAEPRSHPSPDRPPRTPPSDGARVVRQVHPHVTQRDPCLPHVPRATGRRAARPAPRPARSTSPRSSWWIHAPFVVSQPRPHHSQRPFDPSQTPACHPRVVVTGPSKSSPVITVPAGASKRIEAVVPRTATPRPADVARDQPVTDVPAAPGRSRRPGSSSTRSRPVSGATRSTRRSPSRSRRSPSSRRRTPSADRRSSRRREARRGRMPPDRERRPPSSPPVHSATCPTPTSGTRSSTRSATRRSSGSAASAPA